MSFLFCCLLLEPGFARPAGASSEIFLAGRAIVIDGDTLEIRGQRVRLWDVDAPERRQICLNEQFQSYHCGQKAAFVLDHLIGQQQVSCQRRGLDRYRRMVALCRVQGKDLGQMMVREGWSLAFRRYSDDLYVSEEMQAIKGHRGLWDGMFDRPWMWRALNRAG